MKMYKKQSFLTSQRSRASLQKLIFVILDGMADNPKGTLLEECDLPSLDEMCRNGSLGMVKVLPDADRVPQSDESIFSLFGLDTSKGYPGRGPVEALGSGCISKQEKNYLALRFNFETVENEDSIWDARIIDRRAGRTLTTRDAEILGKALHDEVDIDCDFVVKPTVEHRGSLVFKGKDFECITDTDPSYSTGRLLPQESKGRHAELLNSFVEQSYEILSSHDINLERIRKGLLPANIILTRGAGISLPNMKPVMDSYKRKWCAILGRPMEAGIADICGMKLLRFKYPEIDENSSKDIYNLHIHPSLEETSKEAANILRKNFNSFDAFWVHMKEFDDPGHDGRPEDKKKLIETVDRNFFSKVKGMDAMFVITADHATPCEKKSHSQDKVPLLVSGIKDSKNKRFREEDFIKGSLGTIKGPELLKKAIGMMR